MNYLLRFVGLPIFHQLSPHSLQVACFFGSRLCRILFLYWYLLRKIFFSVLRFHFDSGGPKKHQLFLPLSWFDSKSVGRLPIDITKRNEHFFGAAHHHTPIVSTNNRLAFLRLWILLVLRKGVTYNSNFTCEFRCLEQIEIFDSEGSHVVFRWFVIKHFILTKVTVTGQDAKRLLKPLILANCHLAFDNEEYFVNLLTRLQDFLTWLEDASV